MAWRESSSRPVNQNCSFSGIPRESGPRAFGIKGLASDLRDLPVALLRLLQAEGISRYVITGYSSGGYPSLYTAQQMDPIGYLGYSIFTDISDEAEVKRPMIYQKIRHQLPSDLFMNLAGKLRERPAPLQGSIYFGERNALDSAHAELLRKIEGINLTSLTESNHDVTSFLLEEGRFLKPFETLVQS
ncbi:MAG: hypothetical protein NTU78_16290 [Alphaproteobacteria bacterium]|nr:hypothetical protein [Alphaproteobacteria bacterium]